jgi:hypothetical protein
MDFPIPHKLLITPGTILTFKKYPFEDGGKATDKILIVLHCDNEKDTYTTFTFTTSNISSRKIPSTYQIHNFCSCDLEAPIGIDFFYFEKDKVIGEDNFSFNVSTMVMFQSNIRERNMSFFENFTIGTRNEIIKRLSSLKTNIFISLLECILKSVHITNTQETRLKDMLTKIKSDNCLS